MQTWVFILNYCVQLHVHQVEAHYEEERERLESSLVTEKQELITKYQTRQVGECVCIDNKLWLMPLVSLYLLLVLYIMQA